MDLDKILQEKFTGPFRKGYIDVHGFTMTCQYEELKDKLINLEVNEKDVWVCSFPKTGTTWTQEMVWMIMNDLNYVGARKPLDERSPFMDFSLVFDDREYCAQNPRYNPPPYVHDSIGYYGSLKSPLVVKSHLPWQLLPKQIVNGPNKPKLIYVARDARDTCVSYYHHCRLLEGYTGTFDEFCELFLAGKLLYAPFWKHVLPYWERRNSPNILFLKFENMKEDLPGVIHQVAEFLGKNLKKEEVQKLTKHLSFESMKKNEAVNKDALVELNKRLKFTDYLDGKFMRSGNVGEYRTVMTAEMRKRFDEWIKKQTADTDYV